MGIRSGVFYPSDTLEEAGGVEVSLEDNGVVFRQGDLKWRMMRHLGRLDMERSCNTSVPRHFINTQERLGHFCLIHDGHACFSDGECLTAVSVLSKGKI